MANTSHQEAPSMLYGYVIRHNQRSERWEVFWREEKEDQDFATRAEAEEWIEDLIPLNR
jgi:hypothetical protein